MAFCLVEEKHHIYLILFYSTLWGRYVFAYRSRARCIFISNNTGVAPNNDEPLRTIYRVAVYIWIFMGLSYISLVIKSLSKIFVKRAKKVQKNALKKVATQNVSTMSWLNFQIKISLHMVSIYKYPNLSWSVSLHERHHNNEWHITS